MGDGEKQPGVDQLLARGDYYEALGLQADATARQLLEALITARRDHPELDAQWNLAHGILVQQRQLYDQACGVRDEVQAQIARQFAPAVTKRLTLQVVWSRAWDDFSRHGSAALSREALLAEAQRWQECEQYYAEVRARLAAEHGPAAPQLLEEMTNVPELYRKIEHPEALRRLAGELPGHLPDLILRLPRLTITMHELDSGQADRNLRHGTGHCNHCGGKRWVWRDDDRAWVGDLSFLRNVDPALAQRYRSLPATRHRESCPECSPEVTFGFPATISVGQVVSARDRRHKQTVFARIRGVGTPLESLASKLAATAGLIYMAAGGRYKPLLLRVLPRGQTSVEDGLRGMTLVALCAAVLLIASNAGQVLALCVATWALSLLLAAALAGGLDYVTGPHDRRGHTRAMRVAAIIGLALVCVALGHDVRFQIAIPGYAQALALMLGRISPGYGVWAVLIAVLLAAGVRGRPFAKG